MATVLEKRKGRTVREITNIRDIQRIEYHILCHLADFFEEHGLCYFLCGGTLLGAIRHGGFIPWDDDIDILVPRDDYERFKELVRSGAFNNEIYAACLPGEKGCRYPFIKVVDLRTKAQEGLASVDSHVWIDVFPLDHFPDEEKAHGRVLRKIDRQMTLLNVPIIAQTKKRSLPKRLALGLLLLLHHLAGGADVIAGRMDRQARDMNRRYQTSGHCGNGPWPVGLKDYYEVDWLLPTATHRFEGREFRIPHDYDAYLTHFYGDYMTPPPKEQQIDHHLKAWWLPEEELEDALPEAWSGETV